MYTVSGLHRMGLHQHKAFPEDPAENAAAWIERSPLQQAGRIRVPLHLFHGALDTSATTEEMRSIQSSVLAAGGDCELTVFPDDTHGLVRHRGEIHAAVLQFLDRFA